MKSMFFDYEFVMVHAVCYTSIGSVGLRLAYHNK